MKNTWKKVFLVGMIAGMFAGCANERVVTEASHTFTEKQVTVQIEETVENTRGPQEQEQLEIITAAEEDTRPTEETVETELAGTQLQEPEKHDQEETVTNNIETEKTEPIEETVAVSQSEPVKEKEPDPVPASTEPIPTVTEIESKAEETLPQIEEPEEPTLPMEENREEPATETEAIRESVSDAMLRELENYGRSYGASNYGFEIDYSLGFSNAGYYPASFGIYYADNCEEMYQLVRGEVDGCANEMYARFGNIWWENEDGTIGRTRLNIYISRDGNDTYSVWAFYG